MYSTLYTLPKPHRRYGIQEYRRVSHNNKKTEFLFKSRHGVNDTALYMSPRKHKMAILFLIVIGLDGSIQK